MANGEALDLNPPLPGVLKPLDAIRGKDQVEIEGAILELHEVLTAVDLLGLLVAQGESQLPQGRDNRLAVVWRPLDEQVGILSGIGKAEQDRARLAQKEIAHLMPQKGIPNLLCLAILKGGHNLASRASSLHTNGGTPLSCRTPEMARRRAPACMCG